MATARECVCCKEIPVLIGKMSEDNVSGACIIMHPGFNPVCLNTWVLQAAYFDYRQNFGTLNVPQSLHEYVFS